MANVAVGTIAAKSYLPYARVLARSLREHHPEVPFFVLLADEVDGCFDPRSEPYELLLLRELEIPQLERFRFIHPQQPLSYAATPYLLGALLDRGFSRAVFVKQESLVLGDQRPVFSLLEHHSVVLTPHLLAPVETADWIERELAIMQSGAFNIGLVGVSEGDEARRVLGWWQDRVYAHCRHAIADGMHYEQLWMNLMPAFFPDVHVLRDPRWNIAHWNLLDRLHELADCRLFRFSGFDPDQPDRVTRYTRRPGMNEIGEAAALFSRYRAALEAEGWQDATSWPYAYARFDNGVPIPDVARTIYAELGAAAKRFGNPFHTTPSGSFYGWLNQPADGDSGATRLWQGVYRLRPDVRVAFPDPNGCDREAFLAWAAGSGAAEHDVPEAFLAGLRS